MNYYLFYIMIAAIISFRLAVKSDKKIREQITQLEVTQKELIEITNKIQTLNDVSSMENAVKKTIHLDPYYVTRYRQIMSQWSENTYKTPIITSEENSLLYTVLREYEKSNKARRKRSCVSSYVISNESGLQPPFKQEAPKKRGRQSFPELKLAM